MSVSVKALALAAVAALSLGMAQAAEAVPAGVKNIVLVHGAFADGSSWSGVVAALQAKGYHVTAVQNPLTSLADDVAATKRVLAQQDGPTLLVGHSWGGVVITQVDDPKVAGLVYVAALAPDVGESAADVFKHGPTAVEADAIKPGPDGFATIPADRFHSAFAADSTPGQAAVMAATQGPIAAAAFGEKVTNAAWKKLPSWFLVSTADRVINPDLERWEAERIGAHVVSVTGSHTAFVAHPAVVAKAIEDAAGSLKR
ncbi:alpha/beta fold hydrolase [Inquilinus limosus]|uniref:alpha/beta fold hydrolase n=1 Tax=Inquilinus limosus TaxID=171674 RepID=UPI00068FED1B|nr:alpha/beta hydrolase [Inquilinus limosus]